MRTSIRFLPRVLSLVVLVGALAIPAGADLLTFSGELSNPAEPLSHFDTQVDYNYDSGTGVFAMTLTNLTAPPPGYTIADVFFNTSDNVTGLTLADSGAFTHAFLLAHDPLNPSLTRADGFGFFDWTLDLGPNATGLPSGGSATFLFNATGSGLTTADFFSGLSWDATRTRSVGAIKFTEGPDGDHIYAIPQHSIVPEPATLTLLGLGAGGLFLRRRRSN